MIENRRLKVFLCHSKDDKSKIYKLYNRLITDNFDVWLDEVKLIPGQDWDLEIKKAVRNSDTVVVCLSNSSTTKEGYIQKEIRFALDVAEEKPEGTIFIIPAKLEDCNVPSRMSRFQWANLFENNGYSKLKEALQLRMDDLNIRFNLNEISAKANENMVKIPILGKIATDIPFPDPKFYSFGSAFVPENGIEIAASLIPSWAKNIYLFGLEVQGDSLIDAMIHNGDIIVLEVTSNVKNGEMVIISLLDKNETTLKYFYKEKDGYRLQSANPEVKPIILRNKGLFEIRGKVAMVIRKTRIDNVKFTEHV